MPAGSTSQRVVSAISDLGSRRATPISRLEGCPRGVQRPGRKRDELHEPDEHNIREKRGGERNFSANRRCDAGCARHPRRDTAYNLICTLATKRQPLPSPSSVFVSVPSLSLSSSRSCRLCCLLCSLAPATLFFLLGPWYLEDFVVARRVVTGVSPRRLRVSTSDEILASFGWNKQTNCLRSTKQSTPRIIPACEGPAPARCDSRRWIVTTSLSEGIR